MPLVSKKNFNMKIENLELKPKDIENVALQVSEILINLECVKFRINPPFTYSAGLESPVYTDNRLILSSPEDRENIASLLTDLVMIKTSNVDVIAATATAGIAHAAYIAYNLYLPLVYINPRQKGYGQQKQIEGKILKGQKAVVIDDHISTGMSSLIAVKAIRDEGAHVSDVIAITTYGLNEAEINFKNNNIKLHTLTDLAHLCNVALKKGLISQQEISIINNWSQNPNSWQKPK